MPKILEYKNLDWMKGNSSQPNAAVGGLFQYIQGCDPFEFGGLAMPSLVPATQTLATAPKFITGYASSGVSLLNVLTDTKLYKVLKNSPYTVTDLTSSIDLTLPGAATAVSHNGAVIYKNRYIYASGTTGSTLNYAIQSLSLAGAGDTNIALAVNPGASSGYFDLNYGKFVFRFCPGADGNLYFNLPEGVGIITNVSGTTGNTNAAISTNKIDPGFTVRDLINDGRYLVILADNNAVNDPDKLDGDFQSKIYFWDMVQVDSNGRIIADAVWDLKDPYMIGGRFFENAVYFFGHNGLYLCNVATSPKLIRPYPQTVSAATFGQPTNAYQITLNKGSIYWIDGADTTNGYVYAYGNPETGKQKIFYIPYVQSGSIYQHTCLTSIGGQFVSGTTANLNFFNVGSTRGNVVVKSIDTNVLSPYKFEYIKVVLAQKLATGQTVQCIATGANGTQAITSEIKSYLAANPKQQLKFTRNINGTTNSQEKFEDITITINSSGVGIARVALYATLQDDADEDI